MKLQYGGQKRSSMTADLKCGLDTEQACNECQRRGSNITLSFLSRRSCSFALGGACNPESKLGAASDWCCCSAFIQTPEVHIHVQGKLLVDAVRKQPPVCESTAASLARSGNALYGIDIVSAWRDLQQDVLQPLFAFQSSVSPHTQQTLTAYVVAYVP